MTMEALNLGTNIKLIDWAPQNDILGHPAVKAFLTHAGINSLYEAAYHGKPIVSVPLIVDQPANAAKVHADSCVGFVFLNLNDDRKRVGAASTGESMQCKHMRP